MISVKATGGMVTLSLSAGLARFEAEKPRIYREIGQSLLVNIRQGFEAERSPEGEAWEPLKPATVRRRKGDAHPILQRKGRLKKTNMEGSSGQRDRRHQPRLRGGPPVRGHHQSGGGCNKVTL